MAAIQSGRALTVEGRDDQLDVILILRGLDGAPLQDEGHAVAGRQQHLPLLALVARVAVLKH